MILARSGDGGPALLVEGLGSPVAAVRERAAQSLAEMPGGEATAQLRQALASLTVWAGRGDRRGWAVF